MRHHNRARLIDIADMELDPTVEHVPGPDGRLNASSAKEHVKEEKLDKASEELAAEEVVAEEQPKKTAKTATKKTAVKN